IKKANVRFERACRNDSVRWLASNGFARLENLTGPLPSSRGHSALCASAHLTSRRGMDASSTKKVFGESLRRGGGCARFAVGPTCPLATFRLPLELAQSSE